MRIKRILFLLMGLNSFSAFAKNPDEGFYIGGGLGVGIQYFKPDFELFPIPDAEHGVLGERGFVGYQWTKHWAFEFGYTNIGSYENEGGTNNFICTSGNLEQCVKNFSPLTNYFNENLYVKNYINSDAIDLSTKFSFPLGKKFDLFARAGVAYVDATTQSKVNIDLNFFPGTPRSFIVPITAETSSSNHGSFWQQINPVLAIGDDYYFTPQFAFRFEYAYYFPTPVHGDNVANGGTLIPSIILGELSYRF